VIYFRTMARDINQRMFNIDLNEKRALIQERSGQTAESFRDQRRKFSLAMEMGRVWTCTAPDWLQRPTGYSARLAKPAPSGRISWTT
jgi:hypothetical protein